MWGSSVISEVQRLLKVQRGQSRPESQYYALGFHSHLGIMTLELCSGQPGQPYVAAQVLQKPKQITTRRHRMLPQATISPILN